MTIRDVLPATVLSLARLVRTRATLAGLRDPRERRQRKAAVARLRAQTPRPANGQHVLVFSFRGWYPHTAWETTIAHGLRLRGAGVHVFNCGGRLPICEVNFRHADPRVACAECASYPGTLVSDVRLDRSWLADYVTGPEHRAIRHEVDSLVPAEFEQWLFDGQPVGSLVRNSVLWFLRQSRVDVGNPEETRVYRDFLVSGAAIARMAPRLLAATRPDVVLELNGLFFAEQIFNRFVPSTARIATYEAGWRSNSLGFDWYSPRGFADLDTAWDRVKDRPLTDGEAAQLDGWIRDRRGGSMQRDFYVRFEHRTEGPVAQLGLDASIPTAVLFTNLVWDTAVMGRDVVFPTIGEWLRHTVEWFSSRPDRQLVVRVHPAEDLRPSQESREKLADALRRMALPDNVRVVASADPLSSYALIDAAAAVLVYNSTTGMEAALSGKSVVVASRVYYARRGYTLDADSPESYGALIDRAFGGGLLPLQVELARRFAYLLLFRFLHDIPVVKQRPLTLPLLAAEEAGLLEVGGVESFDSLLAALLAGTDLVHLPE